jgi:predicted AlkP superfamily phosphohydrolase/phosphomutase
MEKEFVPYELALRMKQLGFDEPCIAFYEPNNKEVMVVGVPQRYNDPSLLYLKDFCAPTYSQAFRWFREKNDLYYTIEGSKKYGFAFFIYYENDDKDELKSKEYFTYEEAELACLEKLIEIVENNK